VERIRRSLIYSVAHIDRLSDGARIAEASATLMEAPAVVT
jgi:hypothetical protein